MRWLWTLTGYALALAAGGLWLVELTNHEATKRKLRDVQELNRGLQWVNTLQALEIGRTFFGPLKAALNNAEANDERAGTD